MMLMMLAPCASIISIIGGSFLHEGVRGRGDLACVARSWAQPLKLFLVFTRGSYRVHARLCSRRLMSNLLVVLKALCRAYVNVVQGLYRVYVRFSLYSVHTVGCQGQSPKLGCGWV